MRTSSTDCRRRRPIRAAAIATTAAFAASLSACGSAPSGTPAAGPFKGPAGAAQLVASVAPMSGAASTAAESAVVSAEQRFALALTAAAYRRGGSAANVLLSPFSAAADLSMLELGSGPSTAAEIAATLRSTGISPAEVGAGWRTLAQELSRAESTGELQLANSLWVSGRLTVQHGFLDALARAFGNATYQVDFRQPSATDAINAWVRGETAGRIRRLFAPGDLAQVTQLVLANALHFHAAWAKSTMLANATIGQLPFSTASGRTVSVPAVFGSFVALRMARGDGYLAAELPYTNGRFAALLLEPAAGTIGSFVASLSPARLAGIVGALRPTETNLQMPVLHLSVDASLDTVLSGMGLAPLYTQADFSPMLGPAGAVNEALGIVKQAATLDVDRWGTDAAAATGASVLPSAGLATSAVFDHPYLFLVRDTVTGAVLFSSVVVNPS